MEHLYALGVTCIEYIQDWFQGAECYFELINDLSNPHNVLEWLFPLTSIVDSVFAAQLLLCMAFGGWLNAVMKWWLLEDRPYWWVRETEFYAGSRRPVLRQYRQTCETGPGCPSGHTETTAMLLLLALFWGSHVMNDRKFYIWWWKLFVYPLFTFALASVMFARMFVATHFPHQVLLGALVGAFLAPALCLYVSDPFIWRLGSQAKSSVQNDMIWHVASALITVAISLVTYLGLVVCGWDPHWTVKLAFRWCESPDEIHVSTTPMFALVHSTGHLLGWALCVTPAVAKYRHNTKERSLILSACTTSVLIFLWKLLQQNIGKDSAWRFYTLQFILCTIKPFLLLRLAPSVAMWPYKASVKDKPE